MRPPKAQRMPFFSDPLKLKPPVARTDPLKLKTVAIFQTTKILVFEQEDREDTESDHSIRPVTEREQEDRDEIESDQFIQASPHDSGWVIG